MERTQNEERIWSWYKGAHGYAVFNNKYKYISHYEETMMEASKTCREWNKEKREF